MLILKNATFIDWKTFEFLSTDIIVDGENVSYEKDWKGNENVAEIIDCTDKYITKSFACGHHHVYSALALGMPAPVKIPNNFYEILKNIWWQLDKALNIDIIKASAYATAIECAKNGVTYVIDHHSSPYAIEGSLQTISDAFNEVGVGHLLCYEISDRDGVDIAKQALNETENYLQNNEGLVGLHASFTLTNKTLTKAVKLAQKYNTGVHVHVAEDLYDQEHCFDIHNKRVIERFKDYGILDLPKSIFVHSLYLTDDERRLIKQSGAFVAHAIESNLNNSVGQFSSCHLGENIMYGTDGMHSDMLRASKASYFYGKQADMLDINETYRRFRQVHQYTSKNDFNGDDDNNLVVLDYKPSTSFTTDNFLSHFMYGIESKHVQHVIANGKLIVRDKQILGINEDDIKEFTNDCSQLLWDKMSKT